MSCNNLQKALMAFSMLFLSLVSISQDRVITGKVTDSKDGSPLSGVSVSVKGSTTGTQTDANGDYRIPVNSSAATLIFLLLDTTHRS